MNSLTVDDPNPSDDYYAILGCDELSNKDQIQAEYRVRALQLHPDKNPHDVKAMEQFKKLQEAKEVLCDDVLRQAYDNWRNSRMAVSWKTWRSICARSQPTFHWTVTKKEPMIESVRMEAEEQRAEYLNKNAKATNFQWKSAEPTSDYLRKFRNYEV